MRKRHFAGTAFLFSTFLAVAQTGNVPPISVENHSNPPAGSSQAPSEEATVLRAQLQQMRTDDERLLSTVHWALGTLATVAGILIGFGWYVNFRIYERDKAAMLQEVMVSTTKQIGNIEARARERDDAIKDDMRTRITDAISDSIKPMRREFEQAHSTIRMRVSSLDREIAGIQFKQHEADRNYSASSNVIGNVLLYSIAMLSAAIRERNSFHIADALESIDRALQNGAEPNASIRIMELPSLLEKVPKENQILAQRVSDALSSRKQKRSTTKLGTDT